MSLSQLRAFGSPFARSMHPRRASIIFINAHIYTSKNNRRMSGIRIALRRINTLHLENCSPYISSCSPSIDHVNARASQALYVHTTKIYILINVANISRIDLSRTHINLAKQTSIRIASNARKISMLLMSSFCTMQQILIQLASHDMHVIAHH